MARIYLDARAASGGTSGVDRYCRGLIPELAIQAPWHEFVVIHRDLPDIPSAPNVQAVTIGGGTGSLSLLASGAALRRLIGRLGPADIFHALFHVLPFGIRRGARAPARVVVTLHDTIWIDHAQDVARTTLGAAWRKRLGSVAIPYALSMADHVICNSAATAARASRLVPAAQLTPIHLGVSDEFFKAPHATQQPLPLFREDVTYIAAFGVPKAYKNIASLVQAFATLRDTRHRLRLVLIGGDGGAARTIEQAGLQDHVTVTPALSDAAVMGLIRGARVLAVPSKVEGFGLPVCEAMALGTPVVISNDPALREVAGGAALVFEPSNPGGLAQALAAVLDDESVAQGLAAKGRARASHFRWPRAAEATLALYSRMLGDVPGEQTFVPSGEARPAEPVSR